MGLEPATQEERDETAFSKTVLPCNLERLEAILIYGVELFCGIPPAVNGAWVEAQLASVDEAVYVHDPRHVATHEIENIGGLGGVKEIQGGGSSFISYPVPFLYPFNCIYLSSHSHLTGTTNNALGRLLAKCVKVESGELSQAIRDHSLESDL